MGANDYDSREELVRVIVKARHRRWATAELSDGLDDYGDPGCLCCEFIPSVDIELEDDEMFGLAFAPAIPRVTLFDAYKAKRK